MSTDSALPVGILFPMEFEAELIWRKMRGASRMEEGLETKRGQWSNTPIVSARTGMGHAGLTEKVGCWLKKNPCRAVVLAGLAGALDPAWEEGDLTSFRSEDWDEFHQWSKMHPKVRPAKWHTAREIVATGEAKIALGKRTGCGIVEMEWDYVAKACYEQGVPLVGLRGVSDRADKLLPADLFLLGCDAVTGKSTPIKIALYLALRPWRLIELLPAVAGCTHARNELSRALEDFLDGLSKSK